MIWRREEQAPKEDPPAAAPRRVEEARGTPMAEQGNEVTIVGQGARLEGTIVSAGSLRVDGQVKGKITADGDVMLSPQSQVEADVDAHNVTVSGRFKGNITVKGTAELARGGRVDGNVTSKTLVIQEGAIFCGQSLMDQQAARPPQQASGGAAPSRPEATSGPSGDGGSRPGPAPGGPPPPEKARLP